MNLIVLIRSRSQLSLSRNCLSLATALSHSLPLPATPPSRNTLQYLLLCYLHSLHCLSEPVPFSNTDHSPWILISTIPPSNIASKSFSQYTILHNACWHSPMTAEPPTRASHNTSMRGKIGTRGLPHVFGAPQSIDTHRGPIQSAGRSSRDHSTCLSQ